MGIPTACTCRRARSYTYVIHHPDDVKRVLVSNHRNYTKGVGLDRVKILLGKGIMTSEGELWKRQRYMMQPFFHRRVITQFADVIARSNDRFIARWERSRARGEPINLTDEMSELTLDIVLRSIFGRDLDRLTQQLGGNPFEVVTKEPARDLQFAYKFRSLTKLVVAAHRAAPREPARSTSTYLAMLMNGARQGDGRTDGRARADRRGHDADRRRSRDHRERAQLDLVPALAAPRGRGRLHAEIDAAAGVRGADLGAVEALPTPSR